MILKKVRPISLFILLLFGMTGFSLLPALLFNIDLNNLSNNMYISYMFCCDIGFMLILFIIYRIEIIDDFKRYIKNFKDDFRNSFKFYLIGFALMIVSNLVISIFFSNAIPSNDNLVRGMIDIFPLYMIFSVVINAPIVEEIIFRKCIYDSVIVFGNKKINKILYIFISGFIFALLHVLGMTNTYSDYLYIIPYMSLGCVFAYLYVCTENIFSSVSMHALHNGVTIILYFLQGVIL